MSAFIYKSTFEKFDTDKSGFVDRNELRAMITQTYAAAGIPVSNEAIEYQMKKFDANGDGKISLQEYADVMDRYNHPQEYEKYHIKH